ncbi:hypothetical protein [Streptomyces sp. NPDC047043]|uniref:hypothetical protein n=1 Tax=Streptomyces sp. NPDC047043 TaxID=3154497 RepID=UPI0033E9939A
MSRRRPTTRTCGPRRSGSGPRRRARRRISPAGSAPEPDLLGGVTVVSADGRIRGSADAVRLTAVPYRAWANRRPGPMRVWIPES